MFCLCVLKKSSQSLPFNLCASLRLPLRSLRLKFYCQRLIFRIKALHFRHAFYNAINGWGLVVNVIGEPVA